MGVYNATVITNAGQNLIASAIAGGQAINFTAVKTSTHVYPAGTALQNLTSLSDVKQTVAPTSVDVYNNNVVQISARVPNTGIATAYLINTIGLFGNAGGGAETLIAVLTAQTPDEVPAFDAESPAAFIFNVHMTIQNANTVVFEVNDSGTATVADVNRIAQPFIGATASVAGHVGRVPAPAAGDDGKFLRGDATWTAPADMVEAFTSSDVADGEATAWTGVNPLTSGETNKSIFAKLSQMFKNIRYLYKMLGTTNISALGNGTVTNALSVINNYGIKTITRSGTTFTVTRNDDTTFTFNQQDNNTWNANSASVAGYVAAGTGHANKVWKTDANGAPAWRDDANTTYGLASTSNNGLLRQLTGNTSHWMRGDGTWNQAQNNATTTVAGFVLDARMGKTLNDAIVIRNSGFVRGTTSGVTVPNTGAWTNIMFVKPTGGAGVYLVNVHLNAKTGNDKFTGVRIYIENTATTYGGVILNEVRTYHDTRIVALTASDVTGKIFVQVSCITACTFEKNSDKNVLSIIRLY